jgi:hypothetical protein
LRPAKGEMKMREKKKKLEIISNIGKADFRVKYIEGYSEFEVQSELFDRLCVACRELDNGTKVRAEVGARCGDIRAVFDMFVFKHNGCEELWPICAIEVKKQGACNGIINRKQAFRYKEFSEASGIPVIFCKGMDDVNNALNKILDVIS